ncbi:MAG: hypothetical protein E7319_05595 [Clostridiales bacterium]|nr:hypothetical protein [Clostridiales bacterium]
MTSFVFTARPLGEDERYLPLEGQQLHAAVACIAGDGTAENPWVKQVEILNLSENPWQGVIRMALPTGAKSPRFYLPGFLYGTNRGDAPLVVDSRCPRLRAEGDFPASPWWMVRSDRLSHPAAFVYGDGRLCGFAAPPYFVRTAEARTPWQPGVTGGFDQYGGFGCSIAPGEISYTLGYENAPWFFLEAHQYSPRAPLGENCFTLTGGEKLVFRVHQFDLPAQDERTLHDALKWVYGQYHQPPRQLMPPRQAVEEIASAISQDAWLPESHGYAGFVFDRGDHFEHNPLPSISWTNGLAAATPMLQAAHRLGDETMRRQALDCIQHIVDHSMNEHSGLPYMVETDGEWSNRGWWYDRLRTPGHAAYLVGQAMYLILKAYAWEKANRNEEHPDWLRFVKRVLDKTQTTRNTDGEYPYVLSERTGAGLEYDSFSGAWCMAAAAYYSFLTGEQAWLADLLASERYYHQAYVCRQECYGGPLDIDKQIDSEGILAYIRAVHYLHRITGDDQLLSHMQDALYYEFTFKFCYNSPIKTPPLSSVGWSSCGGSITSVTNPHIHPMSSSIIDEMVYCVRHTGDRYVRSRLEDTILWSCQCHNTFDGEYGYGKKGWMSERFCHSQGLVKERYPDGTLASTWFALMPWACGSLLEGLTGEAWR